MEIGYAAIFNVPVTRLHFHQNQETEPGYCDGRDMGWGMGTLARVEKLRHFL